MYTYYMELYHLLNRGNDKRDIVMNDHDRRRFVRDLYEMNDTHAVTNLWYRAHNPFSDLVGHYDTRDRLVTIHAWCLMKNHYHLLVSENREGGITAFLRKLNVGYVKYFNERNNRSGTLFQSRTKKVLIEHEAHFLWILHYIHLNPLDFHAETKNWRAQCLKNPTRALKNLDTYPWSSYNDYTGKREKENYSPILKGSFFYKDRGVHSKETKRYLTSFHKTVVRLEDAE